MIENRSRPGWTLVLAGLGLFMTALDNMVVTTALPVMRQSLHGSLSDLEWTVNAYLLSFACLLLTGAALGDRFGRRRMYCVGLAIFTGASAAAALSPSIGALIAAGAGRRRLVRPHLGAAAAMVVAPVAGKLADRYGNRPFMTAGMVALTAGFGWIAVIAKADLGYGQLWVPLLFAGVGLALVLPTASAEVMRSVPLSDAGVASGTSGALRQLGGVFGVALLAAVFARDGVYTSPAAFTDGLRTALWVAAGLSTAGVLSALAGWTRPARAHRGGSRGSSPSASTALELDLAR